MWITGGRAVRRGGVVVSDGTGSSGQTSALSSDISTNSKDNIFFTTLGGRAAAGLYGPGTCK